MSINGGHHTPTKTRHCGRRRGDRYTAAVKDYDRERRATASSGSFRPRVTIALQQSCDRRLHPNRAEDDLVVHPAFRARFSTLYPWKWVIVYGDDARPLTPGQVFRAHVSER